MQFQVIGFKACDMMKIKEGHASSRTWRKVAEGSRGAELDEIKCEMRENRGLNYLRIK